MRLLGILACFILCIGAMAAGSNSSYLVRDTFHTDHRMAPKILFNPEQNGVTATSAEGLARNYLSANCRLFDLPADLASLRLVLVQESLLGLHFRFQQYINDIPVAGAEIIVSVKHDSGKIFRVFNNTYPQNKPVDYPAKSITPDKAQDIAWTHLRVHGELMCAPRAELVYLPEGSGFRLVYRTLTGVEAPFGYWEHSVDATSGEVVSVRDTAIHFRPGESTKVDFTGYTGPVLDRRAALAAFEAREAADAEPKSAQQVRASGTGKVFDPDPKTTLLSDTLVDTSPAADFNSAYFTRTLQDITFSSPNYSLVGPWVQIKNFENPATAPSTTTTGNWTAVRGSNAFNDVMTYYYIDMSQRYIQSLGYTNIQYLSIEADSDGLSGDDNSHYVPSTNRLAFGHGGVDDNEDVDVILHEYWHAIQHSINSSWGGADTGAMGEGFGDYWPASYGYSTPNGPTWHVDWAFHWDGHNSFWDGRVLNLTSAQYDPTKTYPAHTLVNGINGDELWGTPIWQAFRDLIALGRPRAEMDTIVLESNFGLGANLKMPDMANAMVATAATLYEAGPHAGAYFDRFAQNNILEPALEMGTATVDEPGVNGEADPTETIQLTIPLTNNGGLTLTTVSAILSTTTPGIVITGDTSAYNNIAALGTQTNLVPFTVEIPLGHPCGDLIDFDFEVHYTDSAAQIDNFAFSIGTGILQENSQTASPGLAIPDNNTTGINSTITFSGTGATVAATFNVDMNITHSWIGDLIVKLQSPVGTWVILHNRTGSSADDIIGNYPGTLTPSESLSAFDGQALDGTWTLNVSDRAGSDTGTLVSWGLTNPSGLGTFCEIPGDINGDGLVDLDDALAGINFVAGNGTWTINEWADVNGDAAIGIDEVQFVAEFLAGMFSF